MSAAEKEEESAAKAQAPQQVGGLLFDVDEGVKVEKGPGGSVYMKSNRDYMKDKFEEIDKRFEALEKRVEQVEAVVDQLDAEKNSKGKKVPPPPQNSSNTESRRVLAT